MAAVGEEAEQEVIKGSMMDQLNSSHVAAEMGAAARVAADITVKGAKTQHPWRAHP